MTHGKIVRASALLLLFACAKGESKNATNDSAAGVSAVPTVAVVQQQNHPGALAKPIEQYTGDELFSLARSLRYTGGRERARRCRDNASCQGVGTRRTRVMIAAVEGEDSLSAANVPQYGVIVARAINRGGDREARYGMRPGTRYENYLLVVPGTAGGPARWQLWQLEIMGNRRTATALGSGRFRECNHPFERGARADFKTCDDPASPASAGSLLQGGDPPVWIGCTAGCCVMEEDRIS